MSYINDHNLPEDELLAAEFVLGVLSGTDRAAALRLIERDRNFASMVAAWEQRLSPWAGEIAPVAPAAAVWERIAASLPAQAPKRAGLWQSLAFWRGLSLASSALAAACIGALIYLGNAPQSPAGGRTRRRRPPPFRRHHRYFARQHRRGAGVLFRRRNAGAGIVADPARRQAALARPVARRPRRHHRRFRPICWRRPPPRPCWRCRWSRPAARPPVSRPGR